MVKELESGREILDLCRDLGVSNTTIYNWRKKYRGMEGSHLSRLKELEEEHRKLKQMYADVSLDNVALKDVLSKKVVKLCDKRTVVNYIVNHFKISLSRAW